MANYDQPYVDLGLSVKWASCNLGASSPIKNGNYFSWGEVVAKRRYDWSTYKWFKEKNNTFVKYCTDNSYGRVDNLIELESGDDAASASLGSKAKAKTKWRIPTIEEWQELMEKCSWRWTEIKGKEGILLTGSTGNSIFLPAAGWMKGFECQYNDKVLKYWSSSLNTNYPRVAQCLSESSNPFFLFSDGDDRCWGFSIRPVFEQ